MFARLKEYIMLRVVDIVFLPRSLLLLTLTETQVYPPHQQETLTAVTTAMAGQKTRRQECVTKCWTLGSAGQRL